MRFTKAALSRAKTRGKKTSRLQQSRRSIAVRRPLASLGSRACTQHGDETPSSSAAIQGRSRGYTAPVHVLSPTRPADGRACTTQTSFEQSTPLPAE